MRSVNSLAVSASASPVGISETETLGLSLEAMGKLGLPEPPLIGSVLFVAWLIIFGIVIVWLYAAIRPRFGSGVKTAVYAGLAAWFLYGCLGGPLLGLTGLSSSILGLFPVEGMIVSALLHLPGYCLAVPLGVWIFLRSEFQNHVEADIGGS